MKKKKIVVIIVVVLAVLLFFYMSRASRFINNTDEISNFVHIRNGKLLYPEDINVFGNGNATDSKYVEKYIEKYISKKYDVDVKVNEVVISEHGNGPGLNKIGTSAYFTFEDNDYISVFGVWQNIGAIEIESMEARFKTVSRQKAIDFSEKIEECISNKYNKELKVDEIYPYDNGLTTHPNSVMHYLIYFRDGSRAEFCSCSKKLFDIDSLDMYNFEFRESVK